MTQEISNESNINKSNIDNINDKQNNEKIRVFITGSVKMDQIFETKETICAIKKQLSDENNIPIENISLRYRAKELDNNQTLTDLGSKKLYIVSRVEKRPEPEIEREKCKAECGFWGDSSTKGYCSKCFKELEESEDSSYEDSSYESDSSISDSMLDDEISSDLSEYDDDYGSLLNELEQKAIKQVKPKSRTRCWFCDSKLSLINFECKCGGIYCIQHRYSFAHECKYDHSKDDRKRLRETFGECKASKIQKI